MDDKQILQKIREYDHRIITDLYKRYLNEIITFLQKKYPTFTKQDAEDIFHKSFYILCDNIIAGKNKKDGTVKQYIYSICWHLAYDEYNRGDRVPKNPVPTDPTVPDDEEDPVELDRKSTVLTDVISKLTEPCKTLLILFWYKEKSDKEIVESTDYSSTHTVKNQRSRCMKKLRKLYLTQLVNENMITISDRKRLIGE